MYENLKALRLSLGMNQEEFGKSIGVAKSTYNNYELGIREPKSDFWIAVARKYGVSIDYLMGFTSDSAAPAKPKPRTDPAVAAALFESLPEGRREAAMEYMEALRLIEETQSGETALSEKSA